MTDLIERLRLIDCSWSDEGELAAAAADEIERLHLEVIGLRSEAKFFGEQLAAAHAETDSVVYARDEAYRMLDSANKERDALILAVADHVTHRNELREQLVIKQTHIENLNSQLAKCENEKHYWFVTAKKLDRDLGTVTMAYERGMADGSAKVRIDELHLRTVSIEKVKDERRIAQEALAAQCADTRLLRQQRDELGKSLSKYGHHIEGCGHGWSCTCGFYEAIAKVGAGETGEKE